MRTLRRCPCRRLAAPAARRSCRRRCRRPSPPRPRCRTGSPAACGEPRDRGEHRPSDRRRRPRRCWSSSGSKRGGHAAGHADRAVVGGEGTRRDPPRLRHAVELVGRRGAERDGDVAPALAQRGGEREQRRRPVAAADEQRARTVPALGRDRQRERAAERPDDVDPVTGDALRSASGCPGRPERRRPRRCPPGRCGRWRTPAAAAGPRPGRRPRTRRTARAAPCPTIGGACTAMRV